MKTIIKNHPTAAYLILAFGWTWLIAFAMLFSGLADDVANPSPLFILCGIASGLSPSLAAMLVTRVSSGQEGFKRLMGRFKIKGRRGWTGVTLAIVPTVTAATTVLSSLLFREYKFALTLPMIAMGLIWPLFSSLGEEFGWRGYLLPKLIRRFGVIKAGALLGIVWEVWHLPMHYMAYKTYGTYMIPAFLTVGFLNLTLNAIIMAILYTVNKGSLKLMVLYHYTITSSAILLGALFTTAASPKHTVLESLVSCGLFALISAFLYLKNRTAIHTAEKEAATC